MSEALSKELLARAENFVTQFYAEHIGEAYVYHDLSHTEDTVAAATHLADIANLTPEDKTIALLAAWFHDTGYNQGAREHELRSQAIARQFLSEQHVPEADIERVEACIAATQYPQSPKTLAARILCDADLAHLGNNNYWYRCGLVRQEASLTKQTVLSEEEWTDIEINFLANHEYHTPEAQELFDKNKAKHLKQLYKRKRRLVPSPEVVAAEAPPKKKKKKKNTPIGKDTELKQLNLGRGVETMYRTTYRTHVNLSSIADNKANIMLSINAIIISIAVANLVPSFGTNPGLIIPTVILLATCLTALVFAILSTRPKITEGKFSREDIEMKRSNLLFFGNFYNMSQDDFHWGMMEMIKDSDFLYSSMTRDLYWLGKVLAKKYRYLSICYGIFMYGLILSVLAFGASYFLSGTP